MIEWIVDIDTWLFLQLNAGVANAFFDRFMPFATEIRHLLWLVVPSLVALTVFGGGKGRRAVLFGLFLVTLTDQVSSHLLKPLIARPRPCHDVEGVRLLYRCGRTFAFPSSHAVNSMGAAIFFGILYRRWLWVLVVVAFLNSYSRVYLGIHYPFDVLGGWILGGGMAWGMVRVFRSPIGKALTRLRVFRDKPVRSPTENHA